MTVWLGEVEVTNEVAIAPTASIRDGYIEAVDDLCISVQPFFYDLAGTHGRYPGTLNETVTDNTTNYVYLDINETLQVVTGGYPANLHIRLGRVITLGGVITKIFLERAFLAATDAGGTISTSAKSGLLIPGAFAGNPKKANVVFAMAYPDTNYAVTFGISTSNDKQFIPVIENKATTGFTVNLSVNNIANLVDVEWHTLPVGE